MNKSPNLLRHQSFVESGHASISKAISLEESGKTMDVERILSLYRLGLADLYKALSLPMTVNEQHRVQEQNAKLRKTADSVEERIQLLVSKLKPVGATKRKTNIKSNSQINVRHSCLTKGYCFEKCRCANVSSDSRSDAGRYATRFMGVHCWIRFR
jgi:hypothetical protein